MPRRCSLPSLTASKQFVGQRLYNTGAGGMRSSALVLGAMLYACAGSVALAQTAPQVPAVEGKRQYKFEARVSAMHDSNVA